jgi:peptidoglycan/LPS O-acetylase OafA/YrhL
MAAEEDAFLQWQRWQGACPQPHLINQETIPFMTTDPKKIDTPETDPVSAHRNNFDLIRLLAALQVVFVHGAMLLHLEDGNTFMAPVMSIILLFPGVPIFFCVSGFLIARSVERHLDDLWVYFRARALRIYPALWLCVAVGGVILWRLGYFQTVPAARVAQWLFLNFAAGGASINPEFLRSFGPGVWNGSLWTIFVELSFYTALPATYLLCRSFKVSINAAFILLLTLSFAAFVTAQGLNFGDTRSVGTMQKLVWFSLVGNLWMFLLGTLAHRFWGRLAPFLQGKFLFWLLAYLFTFLILNVWLSTLHGTPFAAARLFLDRGLLALLVLSAAYSYKSLSNRLLRKNDLSYGIYLYHAFIFSLLMHFGHFGLLPFTIGLATAVGMATLSWLFIERKALALKFVEGEAKTPGIVRSLVFR